LIVTQIHNDVATPSKQLEVRCQAMKQGVVVHVTGDLDASNAALLNKELTDVESLILPPAPLVVNLTNAAVSAPGGLSPLVDHARSCSRSGRSLFVVAVDPAIRREITDAGLTATVTVVSTVAEAMDVDIAAE
jgi:anti-anti-sigma factor